MSVSESETKPRRLDIAEDMLNRLLQLDPESHQRLVVWRGKKIAIELLNTRTTIVATVTESGIELTSNAGKDADVVIRGTPLQLLAHVTGHGRGPGVRAGHLQIHGNIALAQDVQNVLQGLEPDFEEELSRWTGDSIAHHAGRLASGLLDFARRARASVEADLGEYLRFEAAAIVDAETIAGFIVDVDRLRHDAERLQARLDHRLKQMRSAG